MSNIKLIVEAQVKRVISELINEQSKVIPDNLVCVNKALKSNYTLNNGFTVPTLSMYLGYKLVYLYENGTFNAKENSTSFDSGKWKCYNGSVVVLRGKKYSWESTKGINSNWVDNSKFVMPKISVPVVIPKELKNVAGVMKFQDWLDENVKGWATGYSNGILNKSKNGYGKFGPRTSSAWKKNKNEFLKSLQQIQPSVQ